MITKCLFKKTTRSLFVILLLLGSFMSNEMRAQSGKTVSGVVIDETGMPIPGANVVEKGTKNSASTDFDGKYNIRVSSSKSELVFSYIGYENLTLLVGQKKTVDAALKNSTSKLDEVVVIGYGTSKKSDLTGSVASVSGSDLKKVAVSNVAEALTGRVAGVQVTSTEGSPDSEIKIRIRGGGSLTQDGSPLIIVDGFPVNSMNDISPSDVENMTILKDASSTAIYGSRGANGVIIITTKGGKNDKLTVNYNGSFGLKEMAKSIDVLNPEDYAKWQYEYAMLTDKDLDKNGVPNSYSKYFSPYQSYAGQKGTNWQKEVYGRTGQVQNHDLGIRGGNEKLSYSFNYAHYDEKAIMMGSQFARNNLSMNLKSKAGEKVDLAFTMRYSKTKINGSGANEQKEVSATDSRLRNSVQYSPILDVYTSSLNIDDNPDGNLVHPFLSVSDNDKTQIRNNFNLLGSFSWKVAKNLQLKSDVGLDNYFNQDYRFYGLSTYYSQSTPQAIYQNMPALLMTDQKNVRFRNANTLNYDFKELLGDNHRLKLLLGHEMIKYNSNTVTSEIQGFPTSFGFEDAKNLTSQGFTKYVDNNYAPDDSLLSFFGRVNYDIFNRYLITGTFRADGSSKFLGNNKWGYFPSVAVGWKLNEEDFLKDVAWIEALKLRASYGASGNNNIPPGQTVQSLISDNSSYINNVNSFWAPSNYMANPDLKWETTITRNLGVDYTILKGRVTGNVDVYQNNTKDLLIDFPISGAYSHQYRNMGETQNRGIEAALNIIAIQKQDYGLSFNFNIGFNKNNVKSLGIMDNFNWPSGWASSIGSDYAVQVGQPIGIMRGYVSAGRYEVSDFDYSSGKPVLKPYFMSDGTRNPDGVVTNAGVVGTVAPGTMKLKDLNGDGIIDANDIQIIGNSNPKHTGGMVINANIKNFDFMAAFNWSYGNDVYNANKVEYTTTTPSSPTGQYRNLSSDMADGKRWTNLDPVTGTIVTDPAALTALNANTTMWSPMMGKFVFSDWAVEDGSFLRLNSLSIGYSVPEKALAKLGLTKLRFYQTMNNVFIITNYSGPDPEVSTRRKTPLTPGVDSSAYPRSRQVVFGLNLAF